MRAWLPLARRALRKPPHLVARRLAHELRAEAERVAAPRRSRRTARRLTGGVEQEWARLAARPPLAATDLGGLDDVCPGERARVVAAAEQAVRREVDLLGSGPRTLGSPIDWHTDPRTGLGWPLTWARGIDYANLERPSDVKHPWELSRVQWLVPAAQAYLLTGDERYAEACRDVLEEWIAANPVGQGVNWAIAMESAFRVFSWSYLFHAFAASHAWAEAGFRTRFLTALWTNLDWTTSQIERAEVNGNHYTADAAALVVGGLLFDEPRRHEEGWRILEEELPLQVTPDGVDFEASLAYHRLVCELFLLPALLRERHGLPVPRAYRERVAAMARVAVLTTRDDGTTPLLGDADDARALPLGGQALGDHRYLAGIVAAAWDDEELRHAFAGPRSEIAWLLGPEAAATLPERDRAELGSAAFPDGGLYVLRGGSDHVLVDCGPVGLAGRGGHGHNDCLSVDAMLAGVHLLTDCGSYVYTASPEWRNRFRSTAFHNTPRVDGEEQNRQTVPPSLWSLRADATPLVAEWSPGPVWDTLRASHTGYLRLPEPVAVERRVELDHASHRLTIADSFRGRGEHLVEIPFHLAPGVSIAESAPGRWRLEAQGRVFSLRADGEGWEARIRPAWVSPSYGVKLETSCLELWRSGPLRPLAVVLEPEETG